MGRDKDDRKRHRSSSHKSKRHSSRHESRDERGRDDEEKRDRGESKKLTEDEERLYKTAKAYIQEQAKNDRGDARKKRSRGDDCSSSSEESRHKGHRKGRHKSDRKKHHKRSRKEDDRDKKKSKHRHDKDEKKGLKEPSFDTSKLISIGPITNKPPTQALDPSLNYFSHNSHLRLYLYRTYGVYFEDLSSDSSRKYFTEFVEKYNSGKLEEAYYQSQLPDEALHQCSRTKHQWKFRTNDIEEEKLNMVKAGVRKQTEYDAGDKAKERSVKSASSISVPPREPKDDYDREQSYLEKNAVQKLSDKRYRDQIKVANEEIYGVETKPTTGWERQQMKKREQANKTHGAHRDREDAMGGVDLDDDAIYGSGEIGGGRGRDVDFKEAVSKERARRERREAEMAQKVEEGKKREEEKRKEMLAMLGLTNVDAGKKITIAPRRDNGA